MENHESAAELGYGASAKSLHWLVVFLLAVQFALAWTMPDIDRGTKPEGLIAWHLGMGAVILVVAILRLLWNLARPVPLITENVPAWQSRAARATHVLLYVLLIALPLMGWANASARGWSVSLFGLVPLPLLLPVDSPLGRALGGVHAEAALVLLGLVGLHVAAAFYHHFLRRDAVLRRMLP
ncbi:MAG TPA: cytochrome b [Stellaceae bacterium]|nr:cytochrome b [Stellaceae bacterium]